MTRARALQLLEEAVNYLIHQKYAFSASLYDTGAAQDEWAERAARNRDELLEALEVVREPEKMLF